jgi:hypothetical protein
LRHTQREEVKEGEGRKLAENVIGLLAPFTFEGKKDD